MSEARCYYLNLAEPLRGRLGLFRDDTVINHQVPTHMLSVVQARLDRLGPCAAAMEQLLEIGKTSGWVAHFDITRASSAPSETRRWHGAVNMIWLNLLEGITIMPWWRNVVHAYNHFFAAGLRELPLSIHCLLQPGSFE